MLLFAAIKLTTNKTLCRGLCLLALAGYFAASVAIGWMASGHMPLSELDFRLAQEAWAAGMAYWSQGQEGLGAFLDRRPDRVYQGITLLWQSLLFAPVGVIAWVFADLIVTGLWLLLGKAWQNRKMVAAASLALAAVWMFAGALLLFILGYMEAGDVPGAISFMGNPPPSLPGGFENPLLTILVLPAFAIMFCGCVAALFSAFSSGGFSMISDTVDSAYRHRY